MEGITPPKNVPLKDFKLPSLTLEDPTGPAKLGPNAAAVAKKAEADITHFVRGLDDRVAQLRAKQEDLGKSREAMMRRMTTTVSETIPSPIIASGSAIPHADGRGSGTKSEGPSSPLIGGTSASLALPPAVTAPIPPPAMRLSGEDTDVKHDVPSVRISKVRVKVVAVQKDGDDAPPPMTTTAAASNGNEAAKKPKKKDDGRRELIELLLPRDDELRMELRNIAIAGQDLIDVLETIEMWFAIRQAVLKNETQSKGLLEAITSSIGEIANWAEDVKDFHSEYLRARVDIEKSLLKHPTSKVALMRVISLSNETWDSLEDAQRMIVYHLVSLSLTLAKDLPVVAQVLQMEAAGVAAGIAEEDDEAGGTEMMYM